MALVLPSAKSIHPSLWCVKCANNNISSACRHHNMLKGNETYKAGSEFSLHFCTHEKRARYAGQRTIASKCLTDWANDKSTKVHMFFNF